MNKRDSLKLMARSYPGGFESLAVRMGLTLEVLRKKLDGTTHELKLSEIEMICEYCCEVKAPNWDAFAKAVATGCGAYIQLPVREMTAPVCLQRSMSDVIREMSDVATVTISSDSDGVISDNDLTAAMKEVHEAREALNVHEHNLRHKNAAGKPGVLLRAAA